jgi:tRNA pseudouridine32 synthase/23S rRNA pseudouridine746 synthase/23S rRNA pseudouridine1911/1915/1917 synthase
MQFSSKASGTLLEILQLQYPDSSKTTLRSWIQEGRVGVDGSPCKRANFPVAQGQQISFSPKKQLAGNLPILYEDKHLVVVDKPAGMLSVATAFEKGQTAHALLKEKYQPRKVFVVHRLDQETSGVLLFALSEKAYHILKNKFMIHEMERLYVGIVEGKMPPGSGSWHSYLHEDSAYFVHSSPDPQSGSLAVTHYRLLKSSRSFSQVEFQLETGRKNQIRVHCQAAGHSIAGDKKYGAATNPLKRLCLHAHTLAFIHPITAEPMRFTSPPPETFQKLL